MQLYTLSCWSKPGTTAVWSGCVSFLLPWCVPRFSTAIVESEGNRLTFEFRNESLLGRMRSSLFKHMQSSDFYLIFLGCITLISKQSAKLLSLYLKALGIFWGTCVLVLELIAADFHPVSCFLSCLVHIFDVIQFCCRKGIFTMLQVPLLHIHNSLRRNFRHGSVKLFRRESESHYICLKYIFK